MSRFQTQTDEDGDNEGVAGIMSWGNYCERRGLLYRGSDNSGKQFTSLSTKKQQIR